MPFKDAASEENYKKWDKSKNYPTDVSAKLVDGTEIHTQLCSYVVGMYQVFYVDSKRVNAIGHKNSTAMTALNKFINKALKENAEITFGAVQEFAT